tara:strand:- start:1974 stop:2564 length:591 start_codon:yes stop_codon:yes gene_type:complete
MVFMEIPLVSRRQKIGLLGGSFDPAHEAHIHISKYALKYFNLDQVWWMLTPSNPLKKNNPSLINERFYHANLLINHPKIFVTKIEAELNTVYTVQTLRLIQGRLPNVKFVWLMGADNMIQFDKWMNWTEIVNRVPIGILARPDNTLAPLKSKMAKTFYSYRLKANQSRKLGNLKAPSWCYKNLPLLNVSSSQIRAS